MSRLVCREVMLRVRGKDSIMETPRWPERPWVTCVKGATRVAGRSRGVTGVRDLQGGRRWMRAPAIMT
eukprot:206753-Amorphochlora_amoeboformis.AAC.2